MNRTLKHKTPEHWLNYYDSYIKRHEEKTIAIKTRRFEPRQEFNPKPFLIILAIAIISVLALTVLLNPSIRYAITGFVTETLGEPAPTEPLPENITNETTPEIPEIPINETPEEPINITPEIPINETNETQEIPIVPEAQPPSNGTNETKDCFELLKTQSGRYYCKDDDTFYFCDNIEYVEQVEEGDVFRCIGYIESKDKVSKEDCPFDHPDCEITVDNKKGWGPAQVDEKVDYKLSTFHYNFYCSEGHCEIPFYFKSKTPLNGNLAFDATAHLELRNIAVERVLQGGLKEEGNKRVSMQKEDSYYYILSFDFTPELIGSEEGIHKNKPLKFNITVSLDGEKILELDPVGQTDSNAGGALDCDSGGADPTLTLSCAIGDIVVVGVSYEDSGAATSITFTGAPGGFTKLSELNNANLDIEFWNATCTAAVSGATLTAVGAASGSNDECSVVASVYSGARDLNKTVRTTGVAAADPSIAVTGMLSTNGGDWVVDVFGSDIDLTGATGQNVVVNGVDTENAVVYISDCSYLEGGSDGSCTMSWDGSTNEGQIATHIWGGADTSKPNTVAFVTPTLANASKTNRNWIFINASVADDAAISTCIIDWNGTNQTTYMTKVGSGTNVSCWINMTSLPDGNFTFKVHANDTTNNFNMSIYRTIFLDSTGPVIASAKINATTPQVVGRRVKVNASINSGASNVTLTVIPPSGTAYNTSVLKNGNEYYNETIKLDVSGKWQFKFWANDTFGNNATPVFAQDLGNNYYINASNGPQFKDYNKNATNVGAGKFIKFNLTVTDGDGISFVNGTVNGVASVFSLVSGSEWMYQWGPCISSDAKVDFSFVSGNDTMGVWNSSTVTGVESVCDVDGPTIGNAKANATTIGLNEYFCVNATVSDTAGVSTVYANIWNTTEFNNLTMTDLGTSSCDVGSGDGVYGVDIQGTKAGYWNYTRVYANDTQNNWATYALTNNITINVSIANVVWNQTTLNMGNVASGTSRIKNVTVTASEDNLNVKAVWTGGNGTFINATPYLIGDLNSGSTYEVEINCSPSSAQDVGTYYANFTVNSTENSTGSNLEVNCSVIEIDTTFPLINFVFPSPNNNTITGNLSVPYTINFTEKNLDKFDWEINGTNYTFYNQSLVLMLDFDNISDLGEVSGIIKDVSNYSKTGTLNGTTYLPNFAAGKYGLGLNLSDNSAWNQYARINADDALNLRDAVTIETWIYPRSFDLVSPYISGLVIRKGSGGGDQWELRLGDSDIPTGNRIQFILAGGTKLYSDTYLQANQWYHIVGTWNISDTKMRMFINGVEQPTTAVQGTRLNDLPDGFVEIGRDAETGDRTFNGVIDEVRVYNRSLTSQEVWQHFMSNLKKYDANNWTFYTNQSNLTASTYTYRASALDTSGNYNSTLLRTLTTTGQLCGCWNGTKNYICGDTVYESCTMNCNLNTSDTCFTVGADHLIIEGAGYKLMDNNKGGTSSGLYLQYDVNTTVKNFYIINFSNGINLAQAYNNTLENNTFYNNTQGIFVESSAKNKILNSTFVNNTRGIEFATHSSSNLVRYSSLLNDTISIYVYSLGSTPGADLANNTIQDTRLNSTSGSFDFSSAPGGNANANFTLLNTSFDPAKVSVTVGDAVVANVVYSKWYVDVVTNYSSGDKLPATGGTASIYDNSSNLKLSDTVESTSFITRQNVTEFYQTSEGSYYQSNYSINATKGQDYSQTESVNVTWNNLGTDKIQLYLEISCGCNNQTYNYTCGQTVYESCTLNCNINATGNCLTAGADNIILDGAGYKIMGANTGNGIIDTAYLNVTIKNFFISNFTNGLDFENTASSNSTIYNNTITNSSYGVYSIDSNNNLFSLNIIKYNNYGIYLTATEAGTVNNTVMNSVITENNYGIYFYTGIDAKSPYPFITSNIVRDSNVTSYVNDTVSKVSEANNIHNNTLLNVTGNPYNISLSDGGANSALYVQYYVDVATNYSNESAGTTGTVKVYDVTNALALTDTIESTSLITRQNVSEYLAVASGKTYLTNYSFNATRNDDISDTQSANITGNKIDSNKIQLTLTVSNTAPEIEYVSSIPNTNPIESNASAITFSFTAYDAQHVADLDAATIKVNLSVSGNLVNVSHYNTTCVDAGNIDADRENFSCAVDLWYWEPDTIWNVTINISDDSALESTNSSTQFNYNTLTAIKIGPASVSFAGATAGSSNTTASSAILVNNTGNDDDKILAVNASSLYNSSALTIPASKYLGAENFTVDIETGAAKPECDIGGSAFSLSNSTYVSITGSSLLRGNNTKNEGQRNLYYCLANVSSALPVGTYDTTLQGPWWIKILLVAVVPAETLRRLRKKKNKGEKLTKENLIEVLDERLKPLQDTLNQIAETIKEEVIKVPISIFEKDKKLGPAESLVKYLKENLGMKFSEIAKLLKRDQRTIWLTYSNAKEKKKEPNIIKETEIKIPLNIIANRKLSILESVVMHLFGKGMKKNEIAELLGRDIRVIYTIYSRAKNKLEK